MEFAEYMLGSSEFRTRFDVGKIPPCLPIRREKRHRNEGGQLGVWPL